MSDAANTTAAPPFCLMCDHPLVWRVRQTGPHTKVAHWEHDATPTNEHDPVPVWQQEWRGEWT